MFRVLSCLSLLCVLAACKGPETDRAQEIDPLPSWNQGVARRSIMDFVGAVTESDGESYVAPEERGWQTVSISRDYKTLFTEVVR